MTDQSQAEEPSEFPTQLRFPEKIAPGRYEVKCWVGGEHMAFRFKTERDAMRLYRAAARGTAIVFNETHGMHL